MRSQGAEGFGVQTVLVELRVALTVAWPMTDWPACELSKYLPQVRLPTVRGSREGGQAKIKQLRLHVHTACSSSILEDATMHRRS